MTKTLKKLIIKIKSKKRKKKKRKERKYYEEIKFENKKSQSTQFYVMFMFKLFILSCTFLTFDYPIKSRNIECIYLDLSFLKLRLRIKGSIIP